ncbi:response regulator [Spirochaetia bacterium 38H-sp]|uniref:histidine kinase n=1 Tax=Rarispira pelagica TaxID=3141764 RepID=A0ABU9UA29_9SPIR
MAEARVMIVEDDVLTLTFLRKLFERRGFYVETCPSGGDALSRIEELKDFDIVLLDIIMPGINGVDVCAAIREHYPQFKLPVLFLTALGQPSEIARALDAGGNDYIIKPPQEEELFARVRNLVRLKRTIEENQELQELLRLKERIFQLVAHDIKGPVSVILQSAKLMKESAPSAFDDYLKTISDSSRRILELVRSFLALSKVRKLSGLTKTSDISLSVLLLETVQRWNEPAKAKGVELVYSFDRGKEWLVKGDQMLIGELMDNLVNNAVKYTYPNTIVSVVLEERGDWIRFSVRDEGPGISEKDASVIFEEFVSVSEQGGTGLGLTLVKEIARLHGACVGIDRERERGAAFWVDFRKPEHDVE